jgi:hypothetical protein
MAEAGHGLRQREEVPRGARLACRVLGPPATCVCVECRCAKLRTCFARPRTRSEARRSRNFRVYCKRFARPSAGFERITPWLCKLSGTCRRPEPSSARRLRRRRSCRPRCGSPSAPARPEASALQRRCPQYRFAQLQVRDWWQHVFLWLTPQGRAVSGETQSDHDFVWHSAIVPRGRGATTERSWCAHLRGEPSKKCLGRLSVR